MPTPDRPLLGVTMGDPYGIGPEVTVKALADPGVRGAARFVVFGADWALRRAAGAAGIAPFWSADPGAEVSLVEIGGAPPVSAPATPGPTSAGGAASFACVEAAIGAALRPAGAPGRLSGVVTAPISKQAWAMAGHTRWPGHTELFAERMDAKHSAMLFVSPRLRVALVTVHIPLSRVAGALNAERVLEVIRLGAAACGRLGCAQGRERPRIAVCGVNPHAGEGGLLGDDEARTIAPAIERARAEGIDASGPHPGDTVFVAAARGDYDLVVAMYHDQGLIPVKLLGWEEAVNVTLGLPTVRTSPDHGTAYDIAGTNRANARSMIAAIRLAARWARA